jgi:RNA polymerase sigma factor for flagellar operon FliA
MTDRPLRYTMDSAWSHWHKEQHPAAREWLVVNYSSLVKFVAGRLAAGLPKSVDIGDLVSAGVFGLMNAIDRFSPDHGVKFETYAIPRIRGAILDSLRALDWVPRSVRSKSRSIEKAIAELEHTLGRAPTEEEIAEKLEVTPEELQKWLAEVAVGSVGPLDHLVADKAPSGVGQQTDAPEAGLEERALRDHMRDEIKKLPERERTVLVLYYEENLTLGEIGDILGVTESRVSQIHSKAVLQLRSRLSAADF